MSVFSHPSFQSRCRFASGVSTRPRLSCLRISPADTIDAVDVIASRLRHLHYLRQGVLRATLTVKKLCLLTRCCASLRLTRYCATLRLPTLGYTFVLPLNHALSRGCSLPLSSPCGLPSAVYLDLSQRSRFLLILKILQSCLGKIIGTDPLSSRCRSDLAAAVGVDS